jgi:hypothetical protein
VCDEGWRGPNAPGELLEEYPQAFIVELNRRLDDRCHLRFVPGFHDAGNSLGEIRWELIHHGGV